MPNSRKCKHCGKFFTPKRKSQVYCSEDCRNAYYDIHYFHKVTAQKVCPNCGTSFTTTKPLAQTYCSSKCRGEAQEKKAYGELLEFAAEAEQSMESIPNHQKGQFALSLEGKEKTRDYHRAHYVGAHLKTNSKRPCPDDGLCELCHHSSQYRKRRLHYHHFDDANPSAGLYLCRFCHCFAERLDQGMLKAYMELKEEEINRVSLL